MSTTTSVFRLCLTPGFRQTARGFGPALLAWALDSSLCAQPAPHHFSAIRQPADGTAALSLDGSISNMFNLTGAISNQ